MLKPHPKEIVIEYVGYSMLWIYTASEDARRWIENEAPQFGQVFPPSQFQAYWSLCVTPTFDRDEVRTYLLSMGE